MNCLTLKTRVPIPTTAASIDVGNSSKVTIYRYLRTFVDENPKVAEQMRKSGTAITPEDYKKLQEENARLHSELKREKLRADFYEEMVAFGKEVYGIDLKKAGTK